MSPHNQQSIARNVTLAALATLATLCPGGTASAASCMGTSAVDETVRRVLVLLPRRPDCVVVVDPDREAAALAERMRQFDAFTYPGNPTIYVRRHSPVYDQATQGGALLSVRAGRDHLARDGAPFGRERARSAAPGGGPVAAVHPG
jgi:hypothetical protein